MQLRVSMRPPGSQMAGCPPTPISQNGALTRLLPLGFATRSSNLQMLPIMIDIEGNAKSNSSTATLVEMSRKNPYLACLGRTSTAMPRPSLE